MLKAALSQANTSIAPMLVRHSNLGQIERSLLNVGGGNEVDNLYLFVNALFLIAQQPW